MAFTASRLRDWPVIALPSLGFRMGGAGNGLVEAAVPHGSFVSMQPTELYKKRMGIESPWHVIDVRLNAPTATVEVVVEFRGDPCCPRCRKVCAGYDSRRRSWRYLDSCQYKTLLVADMPRVECAEHGVMQIDAPLGGARFALHGAL